MASQSCTLVVPLEHPCFPDHFPGSPIVPGALLLKWIVALLAQNYDVEISFIKQIKFLSAVLPGDELSIECVFENTNYLLLECYSQLIVQESQLGAVHSKGGGRLVLKGQLEYRHE